jgi:DNA-binding GntR family transcriptional regulator
LSVSPDSEAYRVSILYNVDQSPVLWLMAVIPPDPIMSEPPINTKHILLSSLVWRIAGTRTSQSIASIDAVNADNEISQKLRIEYGKALIHVQEIHLSDFERIVFLSHQYLIPRIFKLQMLQNTYRVSERFTVW